MLVPTLWYSICNIKYLRIIDKSTMKAVIVCDTRLPKYRKELIFEGPINATKKAP